MPSNAFANAMSTAANTTTGDNGALMVKDSGNPFVTYFTNIVQSSERPFVTTAVDEMVAYIESRGDTTFDILTLFRFYCFNTLCNSTLIPNGRCGCRVHVPLHCLARRLRHR